MLLRCGQRLPSQVQLILKTGDCIAMDDGDQEHHIISNDQRTASMNSFADAHTPSESPEASSSESSTGGDWESGEFKSNEHVDWPKHRITSKTKLVINKSNTAKQSQQFKVKSSNIKIVNNNKETAKKLRWLTNMRNDPDFRETLVRSVNIQPRQSIDSLDMDYYSTICDNQLSVGSPCKSPSELILKNQAVRNKKLQQQQQHNQLLLQKQHQQQQQRDAATECNVIVVAKPIESQLIGFKIVNNGIASKKHSCDSLCSNKSETTTISDCHEHGEQCNVQHQQQQSAQSAIVRKTSTSDEQSLELVAAATATSTSTTSTTHEKFILKNANDKNKRKSNEQSFKYRLFHKNSAHTSTTTATVAATNAADADVVDGCTVVSPPKLSDGNAECNGNNRGKIEPNPSMATATASTSLAKAALTADDANGQITSHGPSLRVSPGIPRGIRCSPFTFREFKDELLSVMKQNSSKHNNNNNNNNNGTRMNKL